MLQQATPPDHPATQELRLALVCYGGVSLAIWMHGVTKELQKLVVASEAYTADQGENPFPDGASERVYWDLLKAREHRDRVRTRMVIDIVAGTSAGGINGIVLAKALARGLDQEPVTRVWLEAGDLKQLMRSGLLRRMPGVGGKAAAWVAASALGGLRPPLRGDLLLSLVHQALNEMDAAPGAGKPVSPENPVELHVTMTDFRGYDHAVPADSPPSITDRRHRHVLSFHADQGELERDRNYRLAFAARATSSFPGAFAPVAIGDLDRVLRCSPEEIGRFRDEQWRIYELSGAEAGATELVDGGVLDNAPFKLAIRAIQQKPAATETKRRLVFIQPDPPLPAGGADPDRDAGFAETVWGSVTRLPRHEPMLDDLLDLRDYNERVDRVTGIVEAATAAAAPPADGESADDQARAEAGFAYTSYVELKLHGVVERFAGIAAGLCRFPRESAHAAFVRAVMLKWAHAAGLLGTGAPVAPRQVEFLGTFDLDYGERRLRYVIRAVSRRYIEGDVSRALLNELKGALYGHIRELTLAAEGLRVSDVQIAAAEIFDADVVRQHITGFPTPAAGIDAFLEEHDRALADVYRLAAARLDAALEGFGDRVRQTVARVDDWPAQEAAAAIKSAYERFPYWDVLLYPIRKASETAELDRVEVMRLSPRETSMLREPGTGRDGPAKLAGVKAGHFGAFFSRDARENDYLWGRLDAAEWIITTLLDGARERAATAFEAILAQEEGRLGRVAELRTGLARQATGLRGSDPLSVR
jgi:patatin-related protein